MKKLLIKLIQKILYCIDADHRIDNTISDQNDLKFTHVQNKNFESDFGNVSKVFRTVPYDTWELKTNTKTLLAADKHLIIKSGNIPTWMQDIVVGDEILTSNGIEKVVSIRPLNIKVHMYDIQVDTKDHLYYSNGILSHNTTCASGYLLWRAMFVPDSTILITANKYVQALEIMDRVRFVYENLPDHIRAGVKEYNKGTIAFDNGSKIVSRATSADAGRGLSISLLYCLGGENTVTVRDKETGEIKQISLEELYNELDQ